MGVRSHTALRPILLVPILHFYSKTSSHSIANARSSPHDNLTLDISSRNLRDHLTIRVLSRPEYREFAEATVPNLSHVA